MTFTATDTIFKVIRVSALLQHLFIIISLQKNGMALFKVIDHLLTNSANIGEHTYSDMITGDYKTMRIAGVMKFRKGKNTQVANLHFSEWLQENNPVKV